MLIVPLTFGSTMKLRAGDLRDGPDDGVNVRIHEAELLPASSAASTRATGSASNATIAKTANQAPPGRPARFATLRQRCSFEIKRMPAMVMPLY